jgi:predicted Rossmann-fold nucleotide-binding protein
VSWEVLGGPPENIEAAVAIGKMIAERKAVLITGATTGLPFHAARGAKLSEVK